MIVGAVHYYREKFGEEVIEYLPFLFMQKEFRLYFLVPVASTRFKYSMFSSSWSFYKEHTVNIVLQMPYRNGRLGYTLPFYGPEFTLLYMCIILYRCNEPESNSKVNFPGHLYSFQIAKLRKSTPSYKYNNASLQ
mgnify:CR=1 FL=1